MTKLVNKSATPIKKVRAKTARPVGAPRFPYTHELGAEICDRIALGEFIHNICAEKNMPSHTTVLEWLREPSPSNKKANPDFARMYASAIELRTDYNHDKMIEIAFTPIPTEIIIEREVLNKNGDVVVLREVRKQDSVQARSLMVDAMKWSISKQGWRKYGTKPGGEDGNDDTSNNIVITGGLPD